MGNGLVEVALLAALTIVVLPCFLFALMAMLDRLERTLDPDTVAPPTLLVRPAPVVAAVVSHDETEDADVVTLPIALTVAEAPAAATG